jgi:metallo-beta-lactamase family protein
MDWYGGFEGRPRVALVHGEPEAMGKLSHRLSTEYGADVVQADFHQTLTL